MLSRHNLNRHITLQLLFEMGGKKINLGHKTHLTDRLASLAFFLRKMKMTY